MNRHPCPTRRPSTWAVRSFTLVLLVGIAGAYLLAAWFDEALL